ncbi:hypothetical protein I601_0627 [Nocardioides dokdonensis FR1436]|uniref:Uncharacterized protein n=2 Tax=Nocardioides TaxID=1839 RepID=A0A1A9GFH5_9ACTN|nr:hypothetical protein I601_0627 [Nocardioides dokdonensis FR1436]
MENTAHQRVSKTARQFVARAGIPSGITLQSGMGLVMAPARTASARGSAYSASSAFGGEAPIVAAPEQVDQAVDEPDATDSPDVDAVEGNSSDCSGGYYIWVSKSKRKSVWAPLKTSKTLGKSRLFYHWTTSKKTDLEIAINPEGGSNYGGGLSSSSTELSDLSIKPDWPNSTSKMVRMKWRYRKHQRMCYYAGEPGTTVAQDVFKWVPEKAMEYTKGEYNNPTFTCNTKGPISARTEFTQSAKVTWGGWFEIIGVRMDNTQTQETVTKLVVDPDSGQTARYCGSNSSGLGTSAFVREISS